MLDEAIRYVARAQGFEVPTLEATAVRSCQALSAMRARLAAAAPVERSPSCGVVVCGSLARGQTTPGSDCDVILLARQASDVASAERLIEPTQAAAEAAGFRRSHQRGPFSAIAVIDEIVTRSAREPESDFALIRRIALLTESVAAHSPPSRNELIARLIHQYCGRRPYGPLRVGLMLSDIVRLWRTMHVHVEIRRDWGTLADGWLVHAKVMTVYRTMFAGSLAALWRGEQAASHDGLEGLTTVLIDEFNRSPLARLAELHDITSTAGRAALGQVVAANDTFLALLSKPDARALLSTADASDARFVSLRARIEDAAAEIEQGLQTLFFEEPPLRHFTRKAGLF